MMSNCDDKQKSGTQGAADYVSDVPDYSTDTAACNLFYWFD